MAIPGIVDEAHMEHNNTNKYLVDGGFDANPPITLAIQEAQQLWPDRQIGVVLSLGLDPSSKAEVKAYKAIDVARVYSPALHFHRMIASNAMRNHKRFHFSKDKTDILEQKTGHFFRSCKREQLLTQRTLDLLFKYDMSRRLVHSEFPTPHDGAVYKSCDESHYEEEKKSDY